MSGPKSQGADPGQPAAGLDVINSCCKEIRESLEGQPFFRHRDPIIGLLSKIQIEAASLSAPSQGPAAPTMGSVCGIRSHEIPVDRIKDTCAICHPVPAAPAAPVPKQPAIVSQYGRVHFLKCHPKPFAALKDEIKGFEYRAFDRDYQVGDLLMLQEWDPETADYTGIGLFRKVTYLISEGFGIPAGYCIMSVVPTHPGSASTGPTDGQS